MRSVSSSAISALISVANSRVNKRQPAERHAPEQHDLAVPPARAPGDEPVGDLQRELAPPMQRVERHFAAVGDDLALDQPAARIIAAISVSHQALTRVTRKHFIQRRFAGQHFADAIVEHADHAVCGRGVLDGAFGALAQHPILHGVGHQ